MRKKTPKTGADLPPARAWQRMLSGRRLDLVDPSPMDIEIEDIAHGLSRVARWNGQTSGGHIFSVAQHSLLVEAIASQTGRQMSQGWRLATLLHDAPEYVIGDMISPFKNALGVDYRGFEERLQRAIHIRFGLPPVLDPDLKRRIKEADTMAAWLEATALAGFSEDEALRIFGPKPDARVPRPEPIDAESCKREFLKKFAELEGQ
ncbi:MAG: HD family hydrolase [Alphaproteobacteria bacterium PRO2]|nr:HD family hydrolase [Alphaproteobacteria bacterium PRO2]